MELYVQEGTQTSEVNRGDWTIFPIGWPGPEPSFGVVQSVEGKTAIVYDVFFNMNMEFMIDRVEVLTPERRANMTMTEKGNLQKAMRMMQNPEAERQAA